MKAAAFWLAVAVAVAAIAGCFGGDPVVKPFGPPAQGVYLGVNLDWASDSPSAIAARLGRSPAVYVDFVEMPAADWAALDVAARQVAAVGGALLVTLEPRDGLGAVTRQAAEALARRLAVYRQEGTPTLVRFAQEMNGSWYPWGQDPDAFVDAFRTVARAIRDKSPSTAMVWAPSYGGGYPFLGGPYGATPGSKRFDRLDTNGDGRLTTADDPYGPYYPGDDYVDWVGMSLYHWGTVYPWGKNELPEPGKFEAQLRGRYDGTAGDERAVPDFYETYAVGHGKPFAIVETAALFAPDAPGPPELDIKQAWWSQALSPDLQAKLPAVRLVSWFEWRKYEPEVGGVIDWRVTGDEVVRDAFRRQLPDFLRFAPLPGQR